MALLELMICSVIQIIWKLTRLKKSSAPSLVKPDLDLTEESVLSEIRTMLSSSNNGSNGNDP